MYMDGRETGWASFRRWVALRPSVGRAEALRGPLLGQDPVKYQVIQAFPPLEVPPQVPFFLHADLPEHPPGGAGLRAKWSA